MGKIINGKDLAETIYAGLKQKIDVLEYKPKLSVVLVGNDSASKVYVNIKKKACEKIGIISDVHHLEEHAAEAKVISLIQDLNEDPEVTGILVQLPLPKHIRERVVVNEIDPKKDVDCLTDINIGRLYAGNAWFRPCTPKGIIRMLELNNVELVGKKAVVVGRSNIVGKPLAYMLLEKHATVTICHSKTKDLAKETKQADILVSAVGRPGLIKKDMVKPGAVVIDVGITRDDGRLKGDVEFEDVKKVASYITPVPYGVGPMTVAMLMENVVKK